MMSTPRRVWRHARQVADRLARRLALASLPIQVEPAGQAGKASRVRIQHSNHTHTLWLPGEPAQVRRVIASARESQYGKINRIGGSLAQGFTAWQRLEMRERPLRCLFVGYGLDTYDAQLLANLGFQIQAEFLDVLDPDSDDPRWDALRRTPGILETAYHQMDARQIGSRLAGERYDLISIVRGSVDLMPPDDYQAVLSGCSEVTAADGLMIAPIVTLQFTPQILTAIRRKFWFGEEVELVRPKYQSRLGQFQLDRLGQYRFVDVAFAGDDLDFRQAIVDELRAFAAAEPAFAELPDLLLAEESADWLTKLATYNGQAGRVLTLAGVPGPAALAAFDITRKPRADENRWAFTARTTLAARRPGSPPAPQPGQFSSSAAGRQTGE